MRTCTRIHLHTYEVMKSDVLARVHHMCVCVFIASRTCAYVYASIVVCGTTRASMARHAITYVRYAIIILTYLYTETYVHLQFF